MLEKKLDTERTNNNVYMKTSQSYGSISKVKIQYAAILKEKEIQRDIATKERNIKQLSFDPKMQFIGIKRTIKTDMLYHITAIHLAIKLRRRSKAQVEARTKVQMKKKLSLTCLVGSLVFKTIIK